MFIYIKKKKKKSMILHFMCTPAVKCLPLCTDSRQVMISRLLYKLSGINFANVVIYSKSTAQEVLLKLNVQATII